MMIIPAIFLSAFTFAERSDLKGVTAEIRSCDRNEWEIVGELRDMKLESADLLNLFLESLEADKLRVARYIATAVGRPKLTAGIKRSAGENAYWACVSPEGIGVCLKLGLDVNHKNAMGETVAFNLIDVCDRRFHAGGWINTSFLSPVRNEISMLKLLCKSGLKLNSARNDGLTIETYVNGFQDANDRSSLRLVLDAVAES